jgi:hypothetical protein
VRLRGADDDDFCISLMMRLNNAWLLAFRILTSGKK